jgi:hypothetical protein
MLIQTGEEYIVPDDLYEKLVNSYGEDMVRNELEAMKMWLYTNPAKRKTLRGMPAFINKWLSRTKKTGGVSPYAAKQPELAAGDEQIRGRTVQMSMTDISWLEGQDKENQKKHCLTKFGFYYDGGRELKYA